MSEVIEETKSDVAEDRAAPVEDIVDVLEPKTEHQEVTLSYEGVDRTYVQKPLSYFEKLEFFGLVGGALDTAVSDGVALNSLLGGAPTSVSDLASTDFADLGSFVNLVGRIATFAPDFLRDCYLVWLGVPRSERAWARLALDSLTDDQGDDIIDTFIDQNYEAIERFFTERVPAKIKRIAARRKKS